MDQEQQDIKQKPILVAPENYRGVAICGMIVSLICCCGSGIFNIINIATAIIALKYADDVDKFTAKGELQQAQEASNKAKLYSNITLILWLVWILLTIAIFLISGFSFLSAIYNFCLISLNN